MLKDFGRAVPKVPAMSAPGRQERWACLNKTLSEGRSGTGMS